MALLGGVGASYQLGLHALSLVALLPLLAVEKIEEAKLKEEGKKRYWDAGKSFLATTMVLISC